MFSILLTALDASPTGSKVARSAATSALHVAIGAPPASTAALSSLIHQRLRSSSIFQRASMSCSLSDSVAPWRAYTAYFCTHASNARGSLAFRYSSVCTSCKSRISITGALLVLRAQGVAVGTLA